jgi:transposase-like protein
MGRQNLHSREFRNSIVAKILSRGDQKITDICDKEGIAYSTAANWVHRRDSSADMKKQQNTSKWKPEQKLKVLMETSTLSESELGAYLRKEGLFSQQLEEWKKDFISSLNSTGSLKSTKDDRDQKIKSLEREILRKDKALAEASALLILQKKVNLIWGNGEEDEE